MCALERFREVRSAALEREREREKEGGRGREGREGERTQPRAHSHASPHPRVVGSAWQEIPLHPHIPS